MAQPYVGEIRPVGFNFAPVGWALCQGQTLPIVQDEALFALIGTTYGGNGQTTFNLPDLRGRIGVHQGNQQGNVYVIGQSAGTESITLTEPQMPTHSHSVMAASSALTSTPGPSAVLGTPATAIPMYAAGPNTSLSPNSLSPFTGGNQPHENRQPFLTVNYIIALFGIFPSQS